MNLVYPALPCYALLRSAPAPLAIIYHKMVPKLGPGRLAEIHIHSYYIHSITVCTHPKVVLMLRT